MALLGNNNYNNCCSVLHYFVLYRYIVAITMVCLKESESTISEIKDDSFLFYRLNGIGDELVKIKCPY
jgi:hypothetical protein